MLSVSFKYPIWMKHTDHDMDDDIYDDMDDDDANDDIDIDDDADEGRGNQYNIQVPAGAARKPM